ncbi:MAG: NUDIX domain-containing protein [Wolinella succinogenes]|uniref:NUDIX domain-containing protein n=1 Tax=Wolinella succinogenes TaxID=844 RepID=UPI0016A6E35D|nr:NUDIX domain-containing protein [Wolinella succinogenes]NLU34543.1 NUDIX domain-containing protein [Wolinella succinogenes]
MIQNIRFGECINSPYVKPKRVFYTERGIEKSWDVVEAHDSVSVLLFDPKKETFVLVKQFRPAVFLKGTSGYTYELCAGIVDKPGKSLEVIAQEEILEECGYSLSVDSLERITSFYTSVGFAGSRQTLFYAEVEDSLRQGEGGGVESENIEVVHLPLLEARAFMLDEERPKTPGLLFAFMWFFERHPKNFF